MQKLNDFLNMCWASGAERDPNKAQIIDILIKNFAKEKNVKVACVANKNELFVCDDEGIFLVSKKYHPDLLARKMYLEGLTEEDIESVINEYNYFQFSSLTKNTF